MNPVAKDSSGNEFFFLSFRITIWTVKMESIKHPWTKKKKNDFCVCDAWICISFFTNSSGENFSLFRLFYQTLSLINVGRHNFRNNLVPRTRQFTERNIILIKKELIKQNHGRFYVPKRLFGRYFLLLLLFLWFSPPDTVSPHLFT